MAQQEKVKLPEGWSESLLNNIASDVSYGYTASSTNEKIGPHLLRITDIQNNKVDWNSVPYCQIDKVKLPQYQVKKNDLLFARTGATVGKSYLVKENVPSSVYASYLIRVRCLDGADIKYMAHFFNSPNYWNQITEFSSGIGQPNVNGTKLKALSIPVAPLPEQKRIVEKLDSLLAQVDTIQQRLNNLPDIIKRFRQSVLAAAATGKLTKSKGEIVSLQDVSILITKGASPKWQGIEYVEDENETLFVTSENVGNMELFLKKKKYVQDVFNNKQKRSVLKKNDVLTNIVGASIGRAALWNKDFKANINQAVCIIRLNMELCSPEYITYFLNSPEGVKQLLQNKVDVARANVSLKNVNELKVFLPKLEEQTEIVRLVEQYFALADTLEKNLVNAKQRVDNLTQSILAKAFRGELVPQDPNDEPADKLLARIKAAQLEAEKLEKAAKKAAKASKK